MVSKVSYYGVLRKLRKVRYGKELRLTDFDVDVIKLLLKLGKFFVHDGRLLAFLGRRFCCWRRLHVF